MTRYSPESQLRPPAEAVRVVVQARPLLPFELAQGARSVVQLEEQPPLARVDRGGAEPLEFPGFDACYDGDVHSLVCTHVEPLVDSVFSGVNSTAFAYGQTCAGKSYTMDRIVATVADHLFHRRDQLTHEGAVVTLRVGYVELYNEKIRDLVDGANRPLGADSIRIEVRERHLRKNGASNSGVGVFLDGAKERIINDAKQLKTIIREGGQLRQTAATGMNSRSSRSHSIITLSVQIDRVCGEQNEDKKSTLAAKLHLVDLAGSERAKRTDTKGARFKEGIQINRSLFALAKVISTLADNASKHSSQRYRHVPYRDSKLTRLLQDSLGGTARTLLVACVSPADTNADETVGTLRYASRAKAIKNQLRVNVDPHAAEVSDLRAALARARASVAALAAENDELRKRLGSAGLPTTTRPVTRRKAEPRDEPRSPRKHLGSTTNPSASKSPSRITSPRRKPRAKSAARLQTAPRAATINGSSTNIEQPRLASNQTMPATSRLRRRRHRNVESVVSAPETISPGPHDDETAQNVDDDSPMDAEVERALFVARTEEMRRDFESRVVKLERDKEQLESDKVELQRKLTTLQEEAQPRSGLHRTHSERPWQLAPPGTTASRQPSSRDMQAMHLVRMRRERDAALKAKSDCERKLADSRAVRDELLRKVSTAMAKVDSVRVELSRDNRSLLKNTSHLKVQLERANILRSRQEATVVRLQVENDVLKRQIRELAAGAEAVPRRAVVPTT